MATPGIQRALLCAALCLFTVGNAEGEVYHSFLEPASENWWPGRDLWATVLYTIQNYKEKQLLQQQVGSEEAIGAGVNRDLLPNRLELDSEEAEDGTAAGLSGLDLAIGAAVGPYITPLASPNISKACMQASQAYTNNIMKKLWALKMFDATGKVADGVMEGNFNTLGNWDECLNITASINASDVSGQDLVVDKFTGKYCYSYLGALGESTHQADDYLRSKLDNVGMIIPILPYLQGQNPVTAICMPSVCTAEELTVGVTIALQGKAYLYTNEELCQTKDETTQLSSAAIVMTVVFSLFGVFMVVGTLIDILDTYAKEAPDSFWTSFNAIPKRCFRGTFKRVLLAFSVYTNGRKLLDTSSTGDTLSCLHGIRFLSNTWVIMGHNYLFMAFSKSRNPAQIGKFFQSVAFLAVDNATVSVDSFFMLSGLLVSYGFMRQMARTRGKFNIVMFYVHRYIRLTPVMMLVIAFIATLYPSLGSGPGWSQINDYGTPNVCRDNWWTNLLYINNYVHSKKQCLGQTWYLANDMQMFIFSPLVLLPLWYFPRFGQLWIILLVCFFTGINAMVTAVHQIGLPGGDDQNLRYQKPWCRAGAYLVGLYTGWILFKIRGKKVHMPSPIVAIGWITSALTACLIVYGVYGLPNPPPKAENIIYPMLNRTAWCICLAWVVFACVTGYGGVINDILSWKALIPLSRLTYTSYLVHIDIQQYFSNTNKMPPYLDQTFIVFNYLGSLPIIFAVSAIFSLAFESPMIALEKIIFPQQRSPQVVAKPAVGETSQELATPKNGGVINAAFEKDHTNEGAQPMAQEMKQLTA